MQDIIFYISLSITIFSLIFFITNRKKLSLCFRVSAVCVTVALFLMMGFSDGRSIFLHIFYSLQIGTLDADYVGIFDSIAENDFKYRFLFYLLSASAPIICGGLIASFFDEFMQIVSITFSKKIHNVFCFSQLNEKSFMLAKSITKKSPKSLIIFYNFDDEDEDEFYEQARLNGFYVISKGVERLIYKSKKQINYFLIKEDNNINLSEGLEILDKYKSSKITSFDNLKMYIFSDKAEDEVILNSTDKKDFKISLIDENSRIVNNLMFDFPVFMNKKSFDDKIISYLIVGSGNLGMKVVKAALWSCQFGNDYKIEINVIDKDATKSKNLLEHECPEFFNPKWNYKINFYDADVSTAEFDKVLKEHCLKTDYIAVCFNDDSLSIKTALFLRRFFIYSDSEYKNEPFIAVRISDKRKFDSIKELTAMNKEKITLKGLDIYSSKSENYNLTPFGSNDSIYSYDGIIDNELDKLSLNCASAYENMFSNNPVPKADVLKRYNYSEIDKKSNTANAIHIKYKLRLLGYELEKVENPTDSQIEETKQAVLHLKNIFSDEKSMEYLGRLEHDRWQAFQISEGWKSVSISGAEKYKQNSGSHKNTKAKLHPCICTWEELDEIIKVFDPHLKDYDIQFIKMIPQILGLEESCVNVAKVKYSLRKSV